MTAIRRIQKELKEINANPIPGLKVEPKEDNLFEWKCTIKADSDSPYKGGTFHFTLTLPDNFPFKPPTVTFSTKIYHPGINEEGAICVPILRDEWKPMTTLSTVLYIIQDKLNNPSADDPFEPDIAAMLKNDKSKFLATAKEWTKKRKSDAKRGHLSGPSSSSITSVIPNTYHQERETPESDLSSANNFLDSLPELPPTNDFRTSLILPDLSRRFSLLRSTAGDQVALDQLRTKLANQRAQGSEHQIPEEVEDMLLETLGRFRSRTSNTPDRSSENVQSEAAGGLNSATSSPARSTKRYTNNLFASGSLKTHAYLNRVGTSSRGSTASSSRTASLTPTEASVAAAVKARVSSSSSTQDGNGSKTSLTNSSPSNSSSNVNYIASTSSASQNGTHTPPSSDSFATPYAISEEGPLLHIYAAEQRLQKALGPSGLKRVSLALGAVIKEIEDEAEDEILVPRLSPSVPTAGGHLDSPTTTNGVGLAVSSSGDNRDTMSTASIHNDGSSSYSTLPANSVSSSSSGGPSAVTSEEPMAISGDAALIEQMLERRASPIPARSVLGYVPGMPRPMTPRDFEYDEVRSHSTTPRAQSPYGELPSVPNSPMFGGFSSPGPSTPTNKHQRRSSTSSAVRGSPSVLGSAAPLFLQRSTNSGRHTPSSSINTYEDSSIDSSEYSSANRSPSPTSTNFTSSMLNSRRRPASPLAGPSFQPLATATSGAASTSPYRISGSRPSTPSNVIWQPSASINTSGHTFSPPPPQPHERPHSRNHSWSTSDGGFTPSSDIQVQMERYGMLSSSTSSDSSAHPASTTNKTIARILSDPALPDSPLEAGDEGDQLMAALGLGGSKSEGNGNASSSSFLLNRKLSTPVGSGWTAPAPILAPAPAIRSSTPTQSPRPSNGPPHDELMQQRNAAGSRRSMRGGSAGNGGNSTPTIGSNGNGSPARHGASTPSNMTASTWSHANNMSTSTSSSIGNGFSDGRPNGAFSPLGFAPRANSSRSSLDSAGSSFHSWEDGDGNGNFAVDRVFGVFTVAANSLEEGKVPTGTSPNLWHDFSGSVNGFTPSPPLNSLKDDPENDPEELMRRVAGLSKDDLGSLQTRLVVAEYTRIANIDPRDRAPSAMRRRRPSTSQSNYQRINSPIPQPPASPTQPHMDEPHHALLNSVVDSIHDRPTAVNMSASGNISSSSDELSPTSRRNRDLAQVLFGSDDNDDDQGAFTPKVRGEYLYQPDAPSTKLSQHEYRSTNNNFANQATPTPTHPSLPSLSASVSSNLTSASNHSNSQGTTHTGLSTPLSSFSNPLASPSHNSPYLLARNPSTHRVPQTAQEEAALVREVKQKADAAMIALNKNPSTTNVTDAGLKHTTSIRRRVDTSQISTPKLVSATTSGVETIPLKSPSLGVQSQASNSQHDVASSKLGSRFKLRLRGSLRAKPAMSSGEETVTDVKSPGPSQVAYYDSSKLNPGTPVVSSATEAGRFKVPVPTPPASAGPGLRGFMARFRNKQRMSESQMTSGGERPLQSIGTPATPISPSTPRAMQYDTTPASPRGVNTPTESRAHTPTPRPPGQPRPMYSRFPPANPPLSPGPSSAPSTIAPVSNSSNTAPRSQAAQIPRPTTPAESLDPSQSAAALEQLFAAAQKIGLDQNALNDLLVRSGSTSSRQLLAKNNSAVAGTSVSGNGNARRGATATSSSQSESEGPGSLSYVGSTGSDKTATPTTYANRPTEEQAARGQTLRPITPDELSRKTSVRKADFRRPPKEGASLDAEHTVLRRTIIYPNDLNAADYGPAQAPQRKTSVRKKRASTQSAKSVVDRAPTPPPPKTTGKRFSADGMPPMPNQQGFQSLGQVDGMLNVPSTSTGLPIEKSNSTYDSLYDMYSGESRIASMAAHDPNLPADQQSETGGHAIELLEMANGDVIWNIVNGLRDGDDESIYTGRTSFESEYSTREPGPDNLQVFVKEHTRSGSKGSIAASLVSKKKTQEGKPRPETKVMYTTSASLHRLLDSLSQGMDAGSFNFQPQSRPPSRPQHSASSSLSVSDPNYVDDKITRMLRAMNMPA